MHRRQQEKNQDLTQAYQLPFERGCWCFAQVPFTGPVHLSPISCECGPLWGTTAPFSRWLSLDGRRYLTRRCLRTSAHSKEEDRKQSMTSWYRDEKLQPPRHLLQGITTPWCHSHSKAPRGIRLSRLQWKPQFCLASCPAISCLCLFPNRFLLRALQECLHQNTCLSARWSKAFLYWCLLTKLKKKQTQIWCGFWT